MHVGSRASWWSHRSVPRINDLFTLTFFIQIHTHSFNKRLLRVYYVLGAGDIASGDRRYPCPCGACFLVGTVLVLLQNNASSTVVPLITDDRKKGDAAWAEYKE